MECDLQNLTYGVDVMSKIGDSVSRGRDDNDTSNLEKATVNGKYMDLSNGVLEINGLKISAETTQDEFESLFVNMTTKYVPKDEPNRATVRIKEPVLFGDMLAKVAIFFDNSKPSKVEVICVEEKFSNPLSSFSHEKYIAKKEFHIAWLKEKLGNPSFQNDSVTRYEYNWGTISATSNTQDPTLRIVVRYHVGNS